MDEETDKERDERLEKLWNTLDSSGDGQIDINGLKKGLKKMDHRMRTSRHA
jgi:solute carrier family 25 (mitochondrial phosphate transporter), member 23/24/25/41